MDSADLYPKLERRPMPLLQHRSDESPAIKLLRSKAQFLADRMQNFIAQQFVEWGYGQRPPAASATYEIRVLDGNLKFREYPDGKQLLHDLPFRRLNNAIRSGGEWSASRVWSRWSHASKSSRGRTVRLTTVP